MPGIQHPVDVQSELAVRPELAKQYRAFLDSIETNPTVSARQLELLRRRIGYIHGLAQAEPLQITEDEDQALRSGKNKSFEDVEQALLTIAEKMPYAHHEIGDDEVALLNQYLSEEAVVVILTAAAFYDVNARMGLSFEQPGLFDVREV